MQPPEQIKALLEGPFAPFVAATRSLPPIPQSDECLTVEQLFDGADRATRAAIGFGLLRWSAVTAARQVMGTTEFMFELQRRRIALTDARDMERAISVAARVAALDGDSEQRLLRLCQYEPKVIARLQLASDADLAVLVDGGWVRGMSLEEIAKEVGNG